MTINNPDETDDALIQQGYPDHIRQLVYEYEEGDEGTPHIQAFIRLFRQQRLSYVKKLFPRGHFKPITSQEHKLATQRYAQKQDETATSHVIIDNQLPQDPITELIQVIEDTLGHPELTDKNTFAILYRVERERVLQRPSRIRLHLSPLYKKAQQKYFPELKQYVLNRQQEATLPIHTHDEEEYSDDDENASILSSSSGSTR